MEKLGKENKIFLKVCVDFFRGGGGDISSEVTTKV